jgi:antirestriction protein ArdC
MASRTASALGITPTMRHADYIGAWLNIIQQDNRAILRAASAATKATDFLLTFRPEAGDAANGDDDPPLPPGEAVVKEEVAWLS